MCGVFKCLSHSRRYIIIRLSLIDDRIMYRLQNSITMKCSEYNYSLFYSMILKSLSSKNANETLKSCN